MRQSVPSSVNKAESDLPRHAGMTLGQWLNAMVAEHAAEPRLERPSSANRAPLDQQDPIQPDPAEALKSVAYRLQCLEANLSRPLVRQDRSDDDHLPMADNQAANVAARLDTLLDQQVVFHAEEQHQQADRNETKGFHAYAKTGYRRSEAPQTRIAAPPFALGDQPTGSRGDPESRQQDAALGDVRDQIAALARRIEGWRAPNHPRPDEQTAIAELRAQIAHLTTIMSTLAPAQLISQMADRIDDLGRRVVDYRHGDVANKALFSFEAVLRDLVTRFAETQQPIFDTAAAAENLSKKLDALAANGADAANLARLQQHVEQVCSWLEASIPAGALASLSDRIDSIVGQFSFLPRLDTFERAMAKMTDDIMESRESTAKNIGDLAAAVQNQIGLLSGKIDVVAAEVQTGSRSIATLEVAVRGMGERLDSFQSTINFSVLDRLEGQLTRISRRLDTAHAATPDISPIERGMSDILAHLQDTRQAAVDAADEAAFRVVRDLSDQLSGGPDNHEVKRVLDNLQLAQENTERRLQHVLEAVEIALARLPSHESKEIDRDWSGESRAAIEEEGPRLKLLDVEKIDRSSPADAPKTMAASDDEILLEPGSKKADPVGAARPDATARSPSPASLTSAPRVAFIAAARRAAKAAAEPQPEDLDEAAANEPHTSLLKSTRQDHSRNGSDWVRPGLWFGAMAAAFGLGGFAAVYFKIFTRSGLF